MTRRLILLLLILTICVPQFATTIQAEEKDAKEILERVIKAAGGERTLSRLKGPMMWMERGTFYGMGDGVPHVAQYASKWPDWYRQEIEGVFTTTVSGNKAWTFTAGDVQKWEGMEPQETLRQIRVAWAERLFPLTGQAYEIETIDGIEVNGRASVGIKASHTDHRDIKFYFDKETYLLVKMETMVILPPFGPDPVLQEVFYSDHKSFGGVRMPSKVKRYYDKKLHVEAETVDYKMGATLDPHHFVEPE